MKFICNILVIFLYIFSSIFAQNDSNTVRSFNYLEDNEIELVNTNEVVSKLEQLSYNPININNAGIVEYANIPFLSFGTIMKIINFRKQISKFDYIEQLFQIPEIDYKEINDALPYLSIKNSRNISKSYKFNLRSRYKNNPTDTIESNYIYNRVLFTSDNIKANFITEKDKNERNLLQYYSYSISLQNILLNERIILGDYNIDFGKGLILGNSRLTKTSKLSNSDIWLGKNRLSEHLSTNEFKFFRGISLEYNFNQFIVDGFYSTKIIKSQIDSLNNIKSIVLYPSSNKSYYNITEISKGVTVISKLDNLSLGLLFINQKYNNKIPIKNLNSTTISELNSYSLYSNYNTDNLTLSNEVASSNNAISYEIAALFNINKRLKFGIKRTLLSSNYFTTYSRLSSNYESSNNVSSNFISFNYSSSFGEFRGYYEQLNSDNASKICYPENSNCYNLTYLIQFFDQIYISSSYSSQTSESFKTNSTQISKNHLFNNKLDIKINRNCSLNTNIIYALSKENTNDNFSKGLSVSQSARYEMFPFLELYGKITFFSTDNYLSRIYSIESDVPGSLATNIIYDEGIRSMLYMKVDINKELKAYIKYSEIYKSRINSVKLEKATNSLLFQIDYQL